MKFIMQHAGWLKSARRWGALALLLTLAVTVGVGSGQGQTNCVPPPADMVAWYPLDEQTGATTVNDIAPPPGSIVNNAGTPTPGPVAPIAPGGGPAPVAGQVNGALYFYGPHVIVPPQAELDFGTGDFTIDAWIKPVSLVDVNFLSLIVHKIDTNGVGYALYTLGNGAGGRTVNLVLNGTTYTSTPSITSIGWYHVAVAVRRSSSPLGTFYINGAPAGTFTPITANLDNGSPLLIGASFLSGLTGLPNVGRHEITIDELEIFNRALSQQEIQDIYNAGSAGKCKLQLAEPTADLGDAPDSSNHSGKAMDAYPTISAKFPTVFDPATGLPQGPKHLQPKGLAWLGKDVSFENEADLLPDADGGVTNIDPPTNAADRDNFDDGVTLPISIPRDCGQTQLQYTVTSTAAAKLYVNVWFDFNRDGDWDDPVQKCPLGPATTGSFTEWAVQNEAINVVPGLNTFTTPVFGAANPTKGSEMWMRITLTDQPIAPANGADGSGPPGGHQFGETEDYLLKLDYSELCGVKFNDLNGDGKQDPSEPGLANWVIEVKDANGNIIGYAVTDANGRYCVVVPSPGTYTVSEQQQAGWVQTAPPTPGTYAVTVPPAHTNLNFGNQEKKEGKAEICVFKFEDLDGDGVKDPNELLLGGWQFTVSPAPLPPTTSPVTTLPSGSICFGVAAPGTYTITEIVQSGWTPTTPNPQTVTVSSGQLVNVFFGNRKKEEAKCDLAIKKTVNPSPLVSGQQATVTITVTNVGTAPCPGPTTVTETVPTGLTLVSAGGPGWTCVGPVCTYPLPIPVNGSVSVTYTFNVTAPPGTAIQNCATVSNPNDPNAANNRDCVTTPVVPGAGVCDREIKKTVTPNPVASGGTVTITLTVTNVGTAPCPVVAGVVLADPKPAGMTFNPPVTVGGGGAAGWACFITGPSGTWPGGVQCTSTSPLLPGPANAVTITFTATVTAPAGSQIQNCAEVTNVGDANQANNKSCVVITVTRILNPVDLALAKLLDGTLRAEQEATYVLRITNVGGAPTTSAIRVVDPLPPQLRFVSATGMGWSCSASGQNVICMSAGPIAPNQSSTIALRVRVAAPAGTQITNCATVETAGDANPANNRGCHTGTVQR